MTSIRWLNTGALSAQDVERWTELARSSATPNPFYEPDFVLPALEHFGDTELELLVAMDGAGVWVGLMPVVRRRRWGRFVGSALTGWDHGWGLTVLCEPTTDSLAQRWHRRLSDRSFVWGLP